MPTITPQTKVAELLEHWPELEPVLIAQAPAFQKLRNPVLRRTIARVASLEQAAAIAGLNPRDLVVILRRAAGQPVDDAAGRDSGSGLSDRLPCQVAADAATLTGSAVRRDAAAPVRLIDADTLLERGEVPLKPVFDEASRLAPGESLQLVASFRPVPLQERLEAHGYACDIGASRDGRFVLTITRIAER